MLVEKGHLRKFMENFQEQMEDKGLSQVEIDNVVGKFYTNRVRVKYSNEDQDEMWQTLMNIVQSPGGISFLINSMDYMPEFEHRRFRGLKSANGDKKTKGL